MLLIVLALVWVVILVPIAIRHFRENGTERSIDSFHAEHDVLSRHEHSVVPAHRLDVHDSVDHVSQDVHTRPRLTVVHADDTYRSLESRGSWDEWSQDYDYDHDQRFDARQEAKNRYAAAYSSVPDQRMGREYHEEPLRPHVSMKVRRTRIFLGLIVSALLFTTLAMLVGSSIVQDVAILCWLGLVGFVAVALFAVSQGYLHETSLPIRRSRRELATIEPLRPLASEEYDSEFYEQSDEGAWRRESSSHYALG